MIVCSCNRMTDADIRAALAQPNGPERARDVYAACGCAPKCGGCAGTINRLISESIAAKEKLESAVERRDAA
jgi:bacterioferritin-associated ferredoxin